MSDILESLDKKINPLYDVDRYTQQAAGFKADATDKMRDTAKGIGNIALDSAITSLIGGIFSGISHLKKVPLTKGKKFTEAKNAWVKETGKLPSEFKGKVYDKIELGNKLTNPTKTPFAKDLPVEPSTFDFAKSIDWTKKHPEAFGPNIDINTIPEGVRREARDAVEAFDDVVFKTGTLPGAITGGAVGAIKNLEGANDIKTSTKKEPTKAEKVSEMYNSATLSKNRDKIDVNKLTEWIDSYVEFGDIYNEKNDQYDLLCKIWPEVKNLPEEERLDVILTKEFQTILSRINKKDEAILDGWENNVYDKIGSGKFTSKDFKPHLRSEKDKDTIPKNFDEWWENAETLLKQGPFGLDHLPIPDVNKLKGEK